MRTYYYLGHKNMPGAQMKQIALSDSRPLVLAGWRVVALKLEARDRFNGWTPEQRRSSCPRRPATAASLSFLWLRTRRCTPLPAYRGLEEGLARQVWPPPAVLLETCVDPRYFTGTVYRAANWILVGQTNGFIKEGRNYRYHGHPKEVYVYPLELDFRAQIGCVAPARKRHFTFLMKERGAMLSHSHDWSPKLLEESGITEENIGKLADFLLEFPDLFREAFNRPVQRTYGAVYLKGLLSDHGAKSSEPIALRYLGPTHVRNLQRFLRDSPGDEARLRDM